jgi:hypothetical protein
MKIRTDSAFVSSVLFTIALACLVPMFWANVITDRDRIQLAKLGDGFRLDAQRMSDLSVVCLAVVLIGLIVLWTGYVKRTRASWGVMFVVVWLWAFPLLVLPLFTREGLSIREWLYTVIYYRGASPWAKSNLVFLLMVIALLLPVKSFFLKAEAPRPIHRPSRKLIGGSATVALLVVVALLAWIRLSAYELSPAELYSWEQLPAPPPPPNPCSAQCGPGGK